MNLWASKSAWESQDGFLLECLLKNAVYEMAKNIPIFPVEGAEGGESREAQEQLCLRSGMGCQPGDTSG